MKCSEIKEICDRLAPPSMACEWDNPGLLAGRSDKEVNRIFLALDATDQVLEECRDREADMLITHHPLIFKGLRQVNDQDFVGRRIMKLIQSDISYLAMHTNFDSAPGCMGEQAARMLGLIDAAVLEPAGKTPEGQIYGIGCCGEMPEALTLEKLAQKVKSVFRIPVVQVFGDLHAEKKLTRIALCPGSGGSTIAAALAAGAQAYISGDISHHEGIDAVEQGMAVIDAGHYGIEHIFMLVMQMYLRTMLPDTVDIVCAEEHFPQTAI